MRRAVAEVEGRRRRKKSGARRSIREELRPPALGASHALRAVPTAVLAPGLRTKQSRRRRRGGGLSEAEETTVEREEEGAQPNPNPS